MSELLASAFATLGYGPSRSELALVADVLRESGDREALDVLAGPLEPVAQLADANGSTGWLRSTCGLWRPTGSTRSCAAATTRFGNDRTAEGRLSE